LYADPEPGLRLGLGCAEGPEDETEDESGNRKNTHEARGRWNQELEERRTETLTGNAQEGAFSIITPNVGVCGKIVNCREDP
jgi:hypothetical protein